MEPELKKRFDTLESQLQTLKKICASNSSAMMDIQQTADWLGVSKSTVKRMTASGELPGYRELSDRNKRWSKAVLLAWDSQGAPQDAEQFELEYRQRQQASQLSV